MKTKKEIVENWLPRYTGVDLSKFGKYILLTNFDNYVERFAEVTKTDICGANMAMPSAHKDEVSIINFGMGSANAA
ncbi:MAG: AMP nucleosidase, partial [Flavobacteriales bacterium]|nr:AMP nucleosidase [Flavobacteriales bacterium]